MELREMLAAGIDPERNEATAYPYWLIIDPKRVPLCNLKIRCDYISSAVTGPFFSRESATEHLRIAAHHFSEHAIVYCASGYESDDWVKLMKMAKGSK